MEDLNNEFFKIEARPHFTIVDEWGNRWNGEVEPDFVFLCIGSRGSELNIIRFDVKDVKDIDKYEVDQIDDNTTEKEVIEFIKLNLDYIEELLNYKLSNPDQNGEL